VSSWHPTSFQDDGSDEHVEQAPTYTIKQTDLTL